MVDYVLSIDSAALLTDTSKRTLWRHLSAGKLQRRGMDERGRVMLALSELAPNLCVTLSAKSEGTTESDYELLVSADRGDSSAQNDLALLFLEQGRPDIAVQWFLLAAQQQHIDAMHYLSELYQQGQGVEKCESTAMLWRAQAAAQGHVIARVQMAEITGGAV